MLLGDLMGTTEMEEVISLMFQKKKKWHNVKTWQ